MAAFLLTSLKMASKSDRDFGGESSDAKIKSAATLIQRAHSWTALKGAIPQKSHL
jgi:hypothetical protein